MTETNETHDVLDASIDWLSVAGLAARWKLSKMTIYRMCLRGEIAHYRLRRTIVIHPEDAEDYLRRNFHDVIGTAP